MRDVTSAHELRQRARHDGLTALLNRDSIDQRLTELLEADPDDVLVAFIDLDGFKGVNDRHGHDVGDEVLRSVATSLRNAVRPTDDVGRYGGDEFVIICPLAFAGAEEAVGSRITSALTAEVVVGDVSWTPAASIGLARARPGDVATDVLRRADRAMYEVKRTRHPT